MRLTPHAVSTKCRRADSFLDGAAAAGLRNVRSGIRAGPEIQWRRLKSGLTPSEQKENIGIVNANMSREKARSLACPNAPP
jgi:hypothetical protein